MEADRLRELVRLRRLGTSAREVVRLLRMGPNTERLYRHVLGAAGLLVGRIDDLPELAALRAAVDTALPPRVVPQWVSSIEAWRQQLEALFKTGLGPRAAFDRLRSETKASERPFRGSYPATKRFFRQLRRSRGVQPEDVAIPVDTAPGEVLQVDLGYAGELYDPATGVMRRAWAFVAVLGFSRHMFVQLTFEQSTEAWLDLHRQAFEFFGGLVEAIVPDCTRRAVTRAAFAIDGPTELNRSYRELAQHYGVKIDPTPPGQPWKKGKAEAAVSYVRRSGLAGRQGLPIDEVRAALQLWNCEVASVRVHGTTGRRPAEAFEAEERAALRPLPAAPYEPAVWRKAKVHPDGHVAFQTRLYSVPWQLVGEVVWLRACGKNLAAFHEDRRIASHTRFGPRRSTLEGHLPPDRRELRHRGRELWEERAARLGPETLALVREVFDEDEVVSHLRRVQAIVTHLERHPHVRAEAASRRARRTGNRSYQGVRDTLARGLDRPEPPTGLVHAGGH